MGFPSRSRARCRRRTALSCNGRPWWSRRRLPRLGALERLGDVAVIVREDHEAGQGFLAELGETGIIDAAGQHVVGLAGVLDLLQIAFRLDAEDDLATVGRGQPVL